MLSDLIAFVSGSIPLGIWLPFLVGTFGSFVWLVVWAGTGFWERRAFGRVLIRLWVIVVALYAAIWFLNPPLPIPTRVIVSSNTDGTVDSADWMATGVRELIRDAINRSEKAFVLVDEELCPGLGRTSTSDEFDSFAQRLKIRWLIDISSDGSQIHATVRKLRSKDYRVVESFSRPVSVFREDAYGIARDVMKTLGDRRSLTKSNILFKNVPDSTLKNLFTAINLSQSGQNDSVGVTFERLSERYPDWQYLGRAYAEAMVADNIIANRELIRRNLKRSTRLDPSDEVALRQLGRIFLEFREWESAESALKLAYSLNIHDPRLYYLFSRLNSKRWAELKFKTYTSLLEQAIYLTPGYETARLDLAKYYMRKRARTEARQVLEEGLAVDGSSTALRQSLSATLLELGESAEAAEICEQIILLDPTHAGAYYNLGIARIYLEDFEGGLAALDSSLAHDGTVDCYYYKGVALQRMGEWERAIKQFQMRFILPKDNEDKVAISARERVQMLKRWIAERDSAAG